MKTDAEIRDKIEWLVNQRPNFTHAAQRKMLELQIGCYEWALGEGPDVILVPKP